MGESMCHKDVRLFGRRLFTIGGLKHKWDTDVEAIPDTTVFQRVDCVRCGYAIDGVKLKLVIERVPWMRRSLIG
jgi:hypothetical protein